MVNRWLEHRGYVMAVINGPFYAWRNMSYGSRRGGGRKTASASHYMIWFSLAKSALVMICGSGFAVVIQLQCILPRDYGMTTSSETRDVRAA